MERHRVLLTDSQMTLERLHTMTRRQDFGKKIGYFSTLFLNDFWSGICFFVLFFNLQIKCKTQTERQTVNANTDHKDV